MMIGTTPVIKLGSNTSGIEPAGGEPARSGGRQTQDFDVLQARYLMNSYLELIFSGGRGAN